MRENYHLKSMPYANVHVAFNFPVKGQPLESIELVSYTTTILVIQRRDDETWVCRPVFNPAYSHSTMRHVNRFTSELYGVNMYYECKSVYQSEQDCLPSLLTNKEVCDFLNYYVRYGKKFW